MEQEKNQKSSVNRSSHQKNQIVKGKQVCTPEESTFKAKRASTPKESKVKGKKVSTPKHFVSTKIGDVTMESLLQFEKSLQQRENTLNEAAATIHAVEFTFGSSDPTLKKIIEEKEVEIRDLHQKLLEKGKSLHLGCDSEIQDLKSQIKYL